MHYGTSKSKSKSSGSGNGGGKKAMGGKKKITGSCGTVKSPYGSMGMKRGITGKMK